jgi:hypothetical protein
MTIRAISSFSELYSMEFVVTLVNYNLGSVHVLLINKIKAKLCSTLTESKPVVRILPVSPSHTTRESLML